MHLPNWATGLQLLLSLLALLVLLSLLLSLNKTVGKVGVKTGEHRREEGDDDNGDERDGHPAVGEDCRHERDRADEGGGEAGGVLLEVLVEGDAEEVAVEDSGVGGVVDEHGRESILERGVEARKVLLDGGGGRGYVHAELWGHGKEQVQRLEVELKDADGTVAGALRQQKVEHALVVGVHGAEVRKCVVRHRVNRNKRSRWVMHQVLVVVVVLVAFVRDADVEIEVEHGRGEAAAGLQQHQAPQHKSLQCQRSVHYI